MISPGSDGGCGLAIGGIAVVLPHFGCEAFLREAIESVLSQEGVELELHLVDDHSPDERWLDAVGDFIDDPRLLVYQTSTTVGPYRIKNALLPKISRPVVAFQDADDVSAPGRFAALLREMARTGADVVGSSFYEMDERGHILRRRRMVRNCNLWLKIGKSFVALHPATIVRRSALEELGGFDGTTRFAADTDFFLRAAPFYKMRNVPEPLYYHRLRSGSLTASPATGLLSQARQTYIDARRALIEKSRAVHDRQALRTMLRAPGNDVSFDLRLIRARRRYSAATTSM
jgi:glycosyltransferase involved in cell wall biosynthesis